MFQLFLNPTFHLGFRDLTLQIASRIPGDRVSYSTTTLSEVEGSNGVVSGTPVVVESLKLRV
jgi:hypothetical protein